MRNTNRAMSSGHAEEGLPQPPAGKEGWPWTTEPAARPPAGAVASDWPTISIVTPSYNQGQYIEETIRSVLLQGYPNLEYIIIDGGSTDDSVEIIKKYAPWLAHWVSEKDRGQSHAINKGLAAASGRIHHYLNSDDILFPGTLHQVASYFSNIRAKPLVCCSGEFFGPAMNEVLGGTPADAANSSRPWQPPVKQRLTDWLTTYSSLFQQSCFWDSRLYDAIGGFSEKLNFCFDKEFFLRAIFEFDSYVPCPQIKAAGHRLHSECKTATIPEVMVQENEQIWAKYGSKAWCQAILRREAREDRSYQLMANALDQPAFLGRAKNLTGSALAWPAVMRSRMFWGAVRRVFREHSPGA
jgi:glycosyltransferase involved in cell wall biosynthesis